MHVKVFLRVRFPSIVASVLFRGFPERWDFNAGADLNMFVAVRLCLHICAVIVCFRDANHNGRTDGHLITYAKYF